MLPPCLKIRCHLWDLCMPFKNCCSVSPFACYWFGLQNYLHVGYLHELRFQLVEDNAESESVSMLIDLLHVVCYLSQERYLV